MFTLLFAVIMASSLAATGVSSTFGSSKPAPKPHQRKVIKVIVDLLRNENPRRAHTPPEIGVMLLKSDKEMKVDMRDQTLLDDMAANPKLKKNEDGSIQYRPQHENINNSIALEKLLSEHPHGMFVEELMDAYHGVEDDIEVSLSLHSCPVFFRYVHLFATFVSLIYCVVVWCAEHLRLAASVQSGEW